ncbi:hypothetical protein [Fusobacterium sp.]|uniref:hypothetical protein n=1 Tax=Fusobacterium sp. TaxID=68766 RepID=UPI002904D002|nr:hypothetical protein [Fusobacterium sp.]MDU1911077.1 hypothetical protein [Fusobacterium sp.]
MIYFWNLSALISSGNKLTKQVIKINNDFTEKKEVYCSKCNKFIYYTKKGWIDISTKVKVKSDKNIMVLKCQCGEKVEINLKNN